MKATFLWAGDNTSANTHIVKYLKANHIDYHYNLGQIVADVDHDNNFKALDCYQIEGDLFGIMVKPRSTNDYFNLTSEELYKKNADGYTKEEALLCDHCIDAQPFAATYLQALEKADYYKSIGCSEIEILQRINNKYAVVSY